MKWRAALAVLAALSLIVGVAIMDHHPVGVFHDDAMYIVLARALATGQGYRWINLPDAPVASHFPPGFPAVLAVLWKMSPTFPANIALFKFFNVLCLAASTLLIGQLARERLESETWGFGVGAVAAVSVPYLVLVTMVLSEPLFLVLSLLVLLYGERFLSEAPSRRSVIALGALTGITVLVRAHGIVLAGAVVIALLLRRRIREASVFAIGVLVIVAPWQIWVVMHPADLPPALAGNYGSYAGWWMRGLREMGAGMIPMTLQRTSLETTGMLLSILSPGRSLLPHVGTLIALGVALVSGGFVLHRRMPVTGLFILAYTAIVLIWPFPPSRFFWGIWPVIVLLFASSAWSVTHAESMPRAARRLVAAGTAWLFLGYALYEVRAIRGQWWGSISRAASGRIDGGMRWVNSRTRPGDVVATDDEGAIFLYTSRQAVPVASFTTAHYLTERSPGTEAEQGLVPLIARYPVRAVIVGSRKTYDAAQVLTAEPHPLLAALEEFPGGVAYTVLRR